MSDSRILTIRKSDSIDDADIMFPLVFFGEAHGYPLSSILRTIQTAPQVHLGTYPDSFPHTIQEYYWIRPGEPGKMPWIALGVLQGDIYFLYSAFMNIPLNTFVNNGHMDLWVSPRYSDIIQYAMDAAFYNDYISNTSNR
jgi:hypothetical protein